MSFLKNFAVGFNFMKMMSSRFLVFLLIPALVLGFNQYMFGTTQTVITFVNILQVTLWTAIAYICAGSLMNAAESTKAYNAALDEYNENATAAAIVFATIILARIMLLSAIVLAVILTGKFM